MSTEIGFSIFFICFSLSTFCRPDGVGTVTLEEKERFQEVKDRLKVLLEKQITNFRSVYKWDKCTEIFTIFADTASRLADLRER